MRSGTVDEALLLSAKKCDRSAVATALDNWIGCFAFVSSHWTSPALTVLLSCFSRVLQEKYASGEVHGGGGTVSTLSRYPQERIRTPSPCCRRNDPQLRGVVAESGESCQCS